MDDLEDDGPRVQDVLHAGGPESGAHHRAVHGRVGGQEEGDEQKEGVQGVPLTAGALQDADGQDRAKGGAQDDHPEGGQQSQRGAQGKPEREPEGGLQEERIRQVVKDEVEEDPQEEAEPGGRTGAQPGLEEKQDAS